MTNLSKESRAILADIDPTEKTVQNPQNELPLAELALTLYAQFKARAKKECTKTHKALCTKVASALNTAERKEANGGCDWHGDEVKGFLAGVQRGIDAAADKARKANGKG